MGFLNKLYDYCEIPYLKDRIYQLKTWKKEYSVIKWPKLTQLYLKKKNYSN